MTEDLLSKRPARPAPPGRHVRRVLTLSVLPAIMAGVWLGRVPLSEYAAQQVCKGRGLDCQLDITRLDFGGVTLRNIRISGDSTEPAVVADRITLDLEWSGPFAARPAFVGGGEIVFRLNATGDGPLLGDLDETVTWLTESGSGKTGGKLPRLDFQQVRVVAATLLGPVEATGYVRSTAPDAFDIEIRAPRTRLQGPLGVLEFAGGELVARRNGGELDGRLTLDLERFDSPIAEASNVEVNLDLTQTAGLFSAKGRISADKLGSWDNTLESVVADVSLQSNALDLAAVQPASVYDGLRSFTASVASGSGQGDGGKFASAALDIRLAPADGALSAAVTASALDLSIDAGAVSRIEAAGTLTLPRTLEAARTGAVSGSGAVNLLGASLGTSMSDGLADAFSSPLGVAPAFSAAAARAVNRAGESFDVTVPLMVLRDGKGVDLSVPGGAVFTAKSGLKANIAAKGDAPVLVLASRDGAAWRGAGVVSVAGGGAPPMTLDLASASGSGAAVSAAGSAVVGPWTVAGETLGATLSDIEIKSGPSSGSDAPGKDGNVSARIDALLTGELAGVDWTRMKAATRLNAAWSESGIAIAAADGVALAWDAATVDKTRFGAGSATYSPIGALAESDDGGGLKGGGVLSRLSAPVTGDGFTARVAAGPTRIDWASDGVTTVNFRTDKVTAELIQGEAITPASFPEIAGRLTLKDGWALAASFEGAEVRAEAVAARDLKAAVSLSGAEGRPMSGRVRDLSLRLSDPSPNAAEALFEPILFSGGADLVDGRADFKGDFSLASNRIQLGTLAGRHELETAAGALTFTGAPLVFNPGSLEPFALSPLLRGPANVTGRIDLTGAASWSDGEFNASANADLQEIGFALASAGVFEGVSGQIEVSDLVKGLSPPGQEITIKAVTLGIPFEDGSLKFQLMGYDAVRLETASWPFAGGRLNIRPVDYSIGAGETRFVGEAIDWDLSAIIERFKIPDLQAEGTVSGEFPIVFSTGSARIDKAVLEASEAGGVIRYAGSTGDAAASADANAKMLFDALKDFRYRVMRVGLDGDLAGRMVLTFDLLGSNPEVFSGAAFDIGISVDSPLLNLLNIVNQGQDEVNAIIERVTTGESGGETQ